MKQLSAFAIKFIAIGILTFSIFGIFLHASVGKLFLMTLIVAGVTFIGDLFVLPRVNQVVAIIADFALLFLLYYLLGNLVVEGTVSLLLPAFAATYLGTAIEAIFHIYMMDQVHEVERGSPIPTRFQTEFAEDEDVDGTVEEKSKQEDRH